MRAFERISIHLFSAALLCAACVGTNVPAEQVPTQPVASTPPAEAERPPVAEEPAAPPPSPPALRLGSQVLPLEYRAELTIDSSKDEFHGVIDIDINVLERTDHLWLHATDITVSRASLGARGQTWPMERLATSNQDFLGFGLGFMFPPGKATLHIEYKGAVSQVDNSGLFRQKEGEHWYVFTQLEPTAARRVFPCFDEPRFKVPWQLTLHVNEGDLAFTNEPQIEEKAGPVAGQKTYRFARTKPLPSYLVALAVGPFEIVDLGQIGRNKTPARIIVPKGRTAETRYAAEVMPRLLDLLESYFDMPYPYAKLDSIALPHFFGAMENPGLITYYAGLLLAPPDKETLWFKRSCAGVAAHELAHQWFGDLVTLDWWDDLWLNESFATWMGTKIVGQLEPTWNTEAFRVSQAAEAMSADSLATARMIRQPIVSAHDIVHAFDEISYSKGSAVLSMFERWIGEERFREGVRAYLEEHAWSTTTADDFLAALENVSKSDVRLAFQTFLGQAGVPLLAARLVCTPGQAPSISLTQERLLPTGSKGSSTETWRVPVCVRYGKGKTTAEQCALLTERAATVVLDKAQACPDWFLANAGAKGYYRVAYAGDMLGRLIANKDRQVSEAERLSLVEDVNALVTTGKLPLGDALALVPSLLKDPSPYVISRAARVVAGVDASIVPDRLRPNYQRFVRKMFGDKARKLGWLSGKSDTDEVRMLRHALVGLVVGEGEDPVLIQQAIKLATNWLGQRKGVDFEILGLVLKTAAQHGNQALYERFVQELDSAKDSGERSALIQAVAATRDPARIEKNFELSLSGKIPLREASPLLQFPMTDPKTRQMAYDYIKGHFDAILDKLPRLAGAYLIYSASRFCDDAHYQDAQTFFKPKADAIPGGPQALEQTLEQIQLCIAFRAAQQPSIEKFLQRY